LLRHDSPELRDNDELRARALVPMANAKPAFSDRVSGYTDFYSSKEHATNVGVMFRSKDNALQPELVAHADRLQRPCVHRRCQRDKSAPARGQLKPPNADAPTFGPCRRLDFEWKWAS